MRIILALATCLLLPFSNVAAKEIRVAVASNFYPTLQDIAQRFENETQHRVLLSAGSTGKHFAQIVQGAPFDVFFAADADRPAKLLEREIGLSNSLVTYAFGKLSLWYPLAVTPQQSLSQLEQGTGPLAIANPRFAPYGRAALQALDKLGLDKPARKIVMGENIAQTFQFVVSGGAEIGFIADSQLQQLASMKQTQFSPLGAWAVPAEFYDPIEQQALLLNNDTAAQAFLDYVLSDTVQNQIRAAGYLTK